MQYLHVTPEQTCLNWSDWELPKLPDKGHVLLHIDIPNKQVYPLPLLITSVQCVYLVSFNLPEKDDEEKALKAIHDTLKDVYAYSKKADVRPEVFLVGLQQVEDRHSFAQLLGDMLKTQPYKRLLVRDENSVPYWTIPGAELSIRDNPTLLSEIQGSCCPHPERTYQSLACLCKLRKGLLKEEGYPIVLYEKVVAIMANMSEVGSSNFEELLKEMHRFGLIFYLSVPESELGKSENAVVLQPQCLRELLRKCRK